MIVCLLACIGFRQQTLKLNSLFADNMVLQRGIPVPFFGVAGPNQEIRVSIAGQAQATKAGADGRWLIKLPALPAGGPYEADIESGSFRIALKNVMIGEVWVCAGQSNMERPEYLADDFATAQQEASPGVRVFTVGKASREVPATDVRGSWIQSSKTTVGSFSAVALAFGREIHTKLGVPVGLIVSAWGGTKAESWTSRDALAANDQLKPLLTTYLSDIKDFPEKNEAYHTELRRWISTRSDNKGNEGYLQGWAQPNANEKDWKQVNLPATLDTIEPQPEGKSFDGAVWFRKTFDMPPAWQGKALRLELGPIRDYDDTYFDDIKVGATKEVRSDPIKENRSYRVSPGIPREGKNTIAIRVFSAQGTCGFTGMPEQMRVGPIDGSPSEFIQVDGPWLERVERKVEATVEAPHMPLGPGSPYAPGGLFNGMIAPLVPYGMRGFIWYQGESNASDPSVYRTLFPTLIRDWRFHWGQANLPFYYVQLANYRPKVATPVDSDWAELREAQAMAQKLPHTGMAVTIDIGDANTIHPTNKREVGRRLSLIALSREYGEHCAWIGPEYQYMVKEGDAVRIFFRHAENGFKTPNDKAPVGFTLAGDDHKFYWATAKVQGTSIVVSSPEVPHPVAVRYAWADNPDCNLYNTEGLPMIPFRTDSWSRMPSTK